MYNFIKAMYDKGKISIEKVSEYVEKGYITKEEMESIVGVVEE